MQGKRPGIDYLASAFLVMVTLVWGITLYSTRDKSRLPMTYIMGIASLLLALTFDSNQFLNKQADGFHVGFPCYCLVNKLA